MIIEKILLVTGSLILLGLGSLHLYYTLFSIKFSPRKPGVEEEMKNTSPRLTSRTTMWKAWIGFNASHSLGAIFFGVINIVLSLNYFEIIRASATLQLINIFTLLFYLYLARKYWFRIPLTGILVSTVCFIIAFVITLAT